MISLNRVIVVGNLTRDPELKVTASNRRFTIMTVAVNDFWKNQNGELVKKATYLSVIAWGSLAENCVKYLKKGRSVMVEGRIETDRYEDKSGVKQNVTRINCSNILFLENSSKKDSEEDSSATYSEQPAYTTKTKNSVPRKVVKKKVEETADALIL
ncbi:MAG: single-stranded DNA-binding protein [Candidatus Riflebacteria bacterium]|nr:single-stranded DNA-binding protein [Candidatus Riflebacteria bacterium]MBR4571345.1 single-stranded DNA-binding protein [Candidatus Riflebacteria bacterium]